MDLQGHEGYTSKFGTTSYGVGYINPTSTISQVHNESKLCCNS
jgi:hypothetical protein